MSAILSQPGYEVATVTIVDVPLLCLAEWTAYSVPKEKVLLIVGFVIPVPFIWERSSVASMCDTCTILLGPKVLVSYLDRYTKMLLELWSVPTVYGIYVYVTFWKLDSISSEANCLPLSDGYLYFLYSVQ
jgi:hypothetical protein